MPFAVALREPVSPAAFGRRAGAPAFGTWADLYQRFRPIYPTAVFDLLSKLTRGKHGLCVELGAGSGQATACLLDRFDRVIAVEPDAAMAGLIAPSPRLCPVVAPAEAYHGPSAPADAVVAASALHWMDQDVVTARAADWLRPGGVFFAFSYGAVQYPGASHALARVLQNHAKRSRVHVHPRLSDFAPYAAAIASSGRYGHVDWFELYAEHRWSAMEVAGFLVSTSYGQAAALSSGDPARYLGDLAAAITDAQGERFVSVRFPIDGAFGLRL